jgi:hypothetical protein
MTFAPQSLLELAAYWKRQEGVFLGIVGDAAHLGKGVSYHLGKDDLIPGAYSAIRPRDRAGLTNAASAIDLGKLGGTYQNLREFSDWLARRCVKHDPATVDVVEVIYSPDGKNVLGFKNGVEFLIPDYGDASHLTHTHISFFRDSETRDKTRLFKPYFEVTDVPGVSLTMTAGYDGNATVNGSGHSFIRIHDGLVYPVADGFTKQVYALAKLTTDFKTASGAVIPRDTPVVVIGDEQAVLLQQEVTLTQNAETHDVTVDGKKYVPA